MKKWGFILAGYVALLFLSHVCEFFLAESNENGNVHQPLLTLSPESLPSASEKDSTILIIHGFFGITDRIQHLADRLRDGGHTVVIADLYQLPHDKRDYSLLARLPSLEKLLDQSDIPPVHVIAFGQGGPAAIRFAGSYPSRVLSLTLLSTSATQKYELLGDYSLNKALYSLQSVCFWSLNHLIPDFGLLKNLPYQQEYFRSLADIDLRPVENELTALQTPSLLIHGTEDYMVPPQAARQHHRLLPNSNLVFFDMSHRMEDEHFPKIASEIQSFILSINAGTFVPEPLSKRPWQGPVLSGPRFWFITGLILVGTKFSEDLATVAAGLLVSQGILPFWLAVAVCFLGIMIGDTAIYFFGRWAGIGILRKRPLCWIISEKQVLDSEQWFENRGLLVIVISRFVPATRLPVYMATGILGVPPLKFISVLSIAALVWTPLIIGLAALLGAPLLHLMEKYEKWSLPILIVFFITLTVLIKFLLPLATRRGRKLFYVRWHRLWQPARKIKQNS
jgi:membrane protein DedA with SNARE-associated domain/pimeloyl-ACP methyl ester carboxylesterase